MADQTYDDVELRLVRDDEQGVYRLGVVVEGAFVSFAGVKTGHVDELVQREQDKANERAQAERQQQQQAEDQQRRDEYQRQRREAELAQQQSSSATSTPPPPQTPPTT